MRILSIETSCDETAIAILECSGDTTRAAFTVLGDALFSQAHLHAEYGGVFPTLAKREHIKNLPLLLEQAMKEAGNPTIDHIVVTQGPGLEPALWTGIDFARELGKKLNVPVHGADHMEGHIVSALVHANGDKQYSLKETALPLLALLISGGHTELVAMKTWFEYELIGRTKDDAVGEAFDKVARMLGLEYPGGPKIAEHAARSRARNAEGTTHNITFPRPLIHENSCDFSFSGLKTAVLYKLKSMPELSDYDKEHVANEFEDAARDVIVSKTRRALIETAAQTLAVGGGVSANTVIRTGLEDLVQNEFPSVRLAYPPGALHLDNAIMIGIAGYLRIVEAKEKDPQSLTARGNQSLATR